MAHTEMRERAKSTIKVENARTRVTEWCFAPGAATGYHRHEYDYVVVPMTSGPLTMIGPDGDETKVELIEGEPYFRPAGVEHDVINANNFEFVFMEIEYK